jgi:long-subunit fatty acid transport protein
MGANYTEDLKAKHKTPLGAGAGASFGVGATRVHAAIDWNGEVSRYTVLESPEFVVHKPSGDSTVKVVISDRMDAVFNWGVGLEHRFSPKLSGFASYHTDLSGRKQGETPSASITAWDLKDVAAGVTWHVLRSDFALGLTTAFGNQPTPSVPGPSEGAPAPQDLQTHEMLVTVSLGWKITY